MSDNLRRMQGKQELKKLLVLLMIVACACLQLQAIAQPLPKVSSGSIERHADFRSKFVQPRHIDVWLPEGYTADKRYTVLYMQDGQALFEPVYSMSKHAWHVDETLSRLLREGRVVDTIVIGIWNTGKGRHAEYFPEKFLPHVPDALRVRFIKEGLDGTPRADNYLRFIVEELKPFIDGRYRTRPGPGSTSIMGSSMGGMISIYAMNEYPQVFGGAAGMSTHWVGGFTPIAGLTLPAFIYLRDHLAAPEGHRLYMDRGTIEIDAWYGMAQSFIDDLVRERGYTSANLLSRVFEGKGHNERDWAARLEIPLLFLLGNAQTGATK